MANKKKDKINNDSMLRNTTIPGPKYTFEQLTELIKFAKENGYLLSINLEMDEDGSVSTESFELLKKVKEAVR